MAKAKSAKAGKAGTASKAGKAGTFCSGAQLNQTTFPLGGMGAGMIGLEATGHLAHCSMRHRPNVYREDRVFAAITVKRPGSNLALVLEAPVPERKVFGNAGCANGLSNTTFGLPRFDSATFHGLFPFADIKLQARDMPLQAAITGWSPFTPPDADGSSMPVAALEYTFRNPTRKTLEAVFSFASWNIVASASSEGSRVRRTKNGLLFCQAGSDEAPWEESYFCARIDEPALRINPTWFRSGWFDPLTMAWNDVRDAHCPDNPEFAETEAPSPGGTLSLPFALKPGESKTIRLQLSWYSPYSSIRAMIGEARDKPNPDPKRNHYRPWYASRFASVEELAAFWSANYDELRARSARFRDAFFDSTIPAAVTEAIAANLAILKTPTVLRQADGRLWCYEGCCDSTGCCDGSCTHVWNYAQAIAHLFPSLERTLRETEFLVCQNSEGQQEFRAPLPIAPPIVFRVAAADGQLGGLMKVFRDWRISGNTGWLRNIWPRIRQSMDYAIATWDPDHNGVLSEPHHNTYDIEFWGPNGMCSSFYLGALKATACMADALNEDASVYRGLYEKGRNFVENKLFNGEYFFQKIQWKGLRSPDPTKAKGLVSDSYSTEALELLKKEGPKYQYGAGCLSDGVLGAWIAEMCGVGEILDSKKVLSHLLAVHKHNLKKDLSRHANAQRPTFALGKEAGLLLCTWPRGNAISLPFPYANEVWTGIEYQVASHLMLMGRVKEGLDIVKAARARYDGRVRSPFDEYECGHWYARALASYGMLQSLSGARYDAVERVLTLTPRVQGDFRCFLATATGYGLVGVKKGKPFVEVREGEIPVERIDYHTGSIKHHVFDN